MNNHFSVLTENELRDLFTILNDLSNGFYTDKTDNDFNRAFDEWRNNSDRDNGVRFENGLWYVHKEINTIYNAIQGY